MQSKLNKRFKRFKQVLFHKFRYSTANIRTIPDFMIVGAMKSGTTSLFHYLIQHPELIPSLRKEVHYFDGGLNPNYDNFERGIKWYRSNFPLNMLIQKEHKTFEASPLYLFNPLAPERIYNCLPDLKIIAILRNPTERAISHYFHERRKGREHLSIEEALRLEEERLKPVIESKDYKNITFIHYSYKKRGHYSIQLERYLKFFPWERILILESEKLFSQPYETLKKIFRFLEVDPNFKIKDLAPQNQSNNRIHIDEEIYKYLRNYFKPYNKSLYELIGEKYDWD